jgi:glycerol-3-phosphate dehydrogenase
MDDDRLVLETLRSANQSGKLSSLNYIKAESAIYQENRLTGLECQDMLTGESFKISASHIVSSVGPWTDDVLPHLVNLKSWKPIMRPSKGIHMTFSRERVPLKDAVVMAVDAEKRIIFAIPRHEMVIIGTTDTDYNGDPSLVNSDINDVNYLLKVVNEYFPGLRLTLEDIVSTYAGVRPLVDDGAETESKTSREHVILQINKNVTLVSGGKYTTYRKMAEETVNKVVENLPLNLTAKLKPSNTICSLNPKISSEYFKSSHTMPKDLQKYFTNKSFQIFSDRHGEEWKELLINYKDKVENLLPEATAENFHWYLEAYFAIYETMCFKLIDFYLRRVPIFLARKNHGLDLLEDLVCIFKSELNWSEDEVKNQISELNEHFKKELGWQKSIETES